MAFSEMTDDLDIISQYPDEPYEEEGFTSTAFKGSFDKGAKLCKAAHNALVRALNAATSAGNIGFRRTSAVPADTVQAAIENVQGQIVGVSQGSVADGSITTTKLEDGAVTANKLAQGSVWGGNIGFGAIESDNIEDLAVTTAKLDDGAVTAEKLGADAATSDKIAAGAVTAEKLGTDAVTSDKIAAGAVGAAALAAGAITKQHLSAAMMPADVTSAVPVAGASCTAVTASAARNVRGRFLFFPLFGMILFLISFDGDSGTNRIKFSGSKYLPSGGIAADAVGADGADYSVSYTAKTENQVWDNDGIFVSRGGSGATLVVGWYFTEG